MCRCKDCENTEEFAMAIGVADDESDELMLRLLWLDRNETFMYYSLLISCVHFIVKGSSMTSIIMYSWTVG